MTKFFSGFTDFVRTQHICVLKIIARGC